MEYTKEKLEWAKSIIQPKLPNYDEKDHELAKMRFVMNEMFNEMQELSFRTGKWAEENIGTGWFQRTYRRLYNWWSKFTGKTRWKLTPRGSFHTMDEVHDAMRSMLWADEGSCGFPDGIDKSDIDQYAEMNYWEDYQKDHLEGIHCGDCVGLPASCGKCHAEQFYNFESPYEGKQAGHDALTIFLDDRKKQQAVEGGEKS